MFLFSKKKKKNALEPLPPNEKAKVSGEPTNEANPPAPTSQKIGNWCILISSPLFVYFVFAFPISLSLDDDFFIGSNVEAYVWTIYGVSVFLALLFCLSGFSWVFEKGRAQVLMPISLFLVIIGSLVCVVLLIAHYYSDSEIYSLYYFFYFLFYTIFSFFSLLGWLLTKDNFSF